MREFVSWHLFSERPISFADNGKFVVGRGYSGWAGGYVRTSESPPVIAVETGTGSGPLSGWIAAHALKVYAFVDPPQET